MKSLLAKSVLIFIILGLTICYGEARAADWKEFAEATTGIFHYDAASIDSTTKGFVRVWIYSVTNQEANLVEFNCKEKSYHVLDVIQYDEANRIKSRDTYYDNPIHNWYDISPKSVPEPLYEIVCP
jgi:hypothetical protein